MGVWVRPDVRGREGEAVPRQNGGPDTMRELLPAGFQRSAQAKTEKPRTHPAARRPVESQTAP
jgi:hypothetical protein